MFTVKRPIEEPLVLALMNFKASPRPEDALRALHDNEVRHVAIEVAQEARRLVMAEDAHRKEAQRELINYREYYVTSVEIGLTLNRSADPRRPYAWHSFASFNTKASKKACKYCAEMRIMRACREAHCVCIGGLVVIGVPQPDGRSGVMGTTLDPCESCRDLMREEYRHLFRDDTLLVTAQPESQFHMVRTIPELMLTHNEEWPPIKGGKRGLR